MSRKLVAMWIGAVTSAAVGAVVACGSFDAADGSVPGGDASSTDATGSGDGSTTNQDGGAGADAADAGDGGDTGAFARTVLTTSIVEPWYLTTVGNDVVVTSRAGNVGGVFRMPKAGGMAPVKIGKRSAWGVAAQLNDVWYCSADPSDYGLVHVPLAGGAESELTSDPCLEVATAKGELYFTGGERDVVEVIRKDGTTKESFGAANGPEGIVADATGVYFAELHGDRITKVPDAVAAPVVLVGDAGPEPRRLALRDDYVYWVEYLTAKVQRARKDQTGTVQEIGRGPGHTREGGIAVDGTHVYWVVPEGIVDGGPAGGVYRVARNGVGGVETVADKLDQPIDVAVDLQAVYVTVKGENKVLRIAK